MILISGCDQGEREDYAFYQAFEVSAKTEGVMFRPDLPGTYRFTITGGAYTLGNRLWLTALAIYIDGPIRTDSASGRPHPVSPDSIVGDFSLEPDRTMAEQVGLERQTAIEVDEFAYFIVPDDLGTFGDNSGSVQMMIERNR
ncbi:MAG TPA: hypothetical protein DCZ95_15930 [Verrucomicrobia bacterium]|nr:hypothetical protein [Verrucomicrobiota bacterium]